MTRKSLGVWFRSNIYNAKWHLATEVSEYPGGYRTMCGKHLHPTPANPEPYLISHEPDQPVCPKCEDRAKPPLRIYKEGSGEFAPEYLAYLDTLTSEVFGNCRARITRNPDGEIVRMEFWTGTSEDGAFHYYDFPTPRWMKP